MLKARQQQYKKEVRDCILDISQRIISEEGLDAISIRRVANEMDYSSGIIYHYFHNKDHLLSCAVREGYRKILLSVKKPEPDLPPDEKLRKSFQSFVGVVMQAPNAYKSFAINFSSGLLNDISILGDNGCETTPTYAWVVSYIKEGIAAGQFTCDDPILTAKIFWCAGYGLLTRFLIEPGISLEQRDALIRCLMDTLLKGISV